MIVEGELEQINLLPVGELHIKADATNPHSLLNSPQRAVLIDFVLPEIRHDSRDFSATIGTHLDVGPHPSIQRHGDQAMKGNPANGPFVDKLLDQNVTFIDPEAKLARTAKALDAARTRTEKLQVMARDQAETLARDVPEVEDLPLAMEEETEEFTHLTITLRVRSIRALEHWSGKPTKLSEVILRVFKLPHPATGAVP